MSFCYLMSKIVKQNLSGINPVPIPRLFVSQRDFICWWFLLCAEGYNGLQNSQFLDLFPRFFSKFMTQLHGGLRMLTQGKSY